jgi:hypothetical protein
MRSVVALFGGALAAVFVGSVQPAPAAAAPPAVRCGDTIMASVTLRVDLRCAADGLIVGADGITVNLNGHTLSGSGVANGVASAGHADLRVAGGTVTGFRRGIDLVEARNTALSGLRLLHNGTGVAADRVAGLRIRGGEIAGPALAVDAELSDRVVVDGVEVTGSGIFFGDTAGSSIVNSVFRSNSVMLRESGALIRRNSFVGSGLDISETRGVSIMDNELTASSIDAWLSDNLLVQGNTIRGAYTGLSMSVGPSYDVRVLSNTFEGNQFGMRVQDTLLAEYAGLAIIGNAFTGNGTAGLFIETTDAEAALGRVTVARNTFRANGFTGGGLDAAGRRIDDGLHTNLPPNSDLVVAGNHTSANADFGIEALPVGSVRDGGGNTSSGDRNGCAGVVCR